MSAIYTYLCIRKQIKELFNGVFQLGLIQKTRFNYIINKFSTCPGLPILLSRKTFNAPQVQIIIC